jgi:hypothetical protein
VLGVFGKLFGKALEAQVGGAGARLRVLCVCDSGRMYVCVCVCVCVCVDMWAGACAHVCMCNTGVGSMLTGNCAGSCLEPTLERQSRLLTQPGSFSKPPPSISLLPLSLPQ